MSNKFKYVTVSEEDVNWGLFINDAGYSEVKANTPYPLSGHPDSYFFNWENGRMLDEYQINYITNGSGIFETRNENYRIQPGTILILFPNVWHRYKPDLKIGWNEHFIGFNGNFAQHIFKHELLSKNNPVLKIGFQDNLLQEFMNVISLIDDEKPGYQQIATGKLLSIFGSVISIIKNNEFASKDIEKKIRKANLYMRDNLNRNINMEELALSQGISYSTFRRMYKKYMGMSPNQYHLRLRIQKSKEMILYSKKSIKLIAYELGFESIHYFSRLYKNKEGISPSEIRKV